MADTRLEFVRHATRRARGPSDAAQRHRMFDNYYQGRRVLVTGHTGFKGSWLSQWLLELGAEVAGYSNGVPTEPSHFELLGLSGAIRDLRGDITDAEALQDAVGAFAPEVIFHLAAQAIVRTSHREPRQTFETNVQGMVNLLEVLRASPSVRVGVLITSDKAYENLEWHYGYRESDRLGGADPYSASKACAEIVASAYFRSFVREQPTKQLATCRAGNVIGGGDWAPDRIVPDCVRAWSQGAPVHLRNPHATRPWQHVLEPLSGYLWLGCQLGGRRREDLNGEAFNFGPAADVEVPVAALIAEMQRSWPDTRVTVADETAGGRIAEAGLLKLCCDKAFHRLRWLPTLDFAETAERTAAWYRRFCEDSARAAAQTRRDIAEYQSLAAARGRIWARGA